MELKDFISETLKQIIDGVIIAQEYASDKNGKINPEGITVLRDGGNSPVYGSLYNQAPAQTIEFDVALTIQENLGVKGKIGVFAGAFKAGLEGNDSSLNSSVNKIKFHIPVFLPNQK